MKIWNKNGELIPDNNIRTDGSVFVCDKNITVDELKFYKLSASGNDIVIDVAKQTARFNELLNQRIKEIDEKTAKLITETGYTFKGQVMSSSDIHRAELESLHNNRDSAEMLAMYPFKFANKDNTAFVEILNAADIHDMYVALNLNLRFSRKMAGNALKEQIQAKDVSGNYVMTLQGLETYQDIR